MPPSPAFLVLLRPANSPTCDLLRSCCCSANLKECYRYCQGRPLCLNRTVNVDELRPYWKVGGYAAGWGGCAAATARRWVHARTALVLCLCWLGLPLANPAGPAAPCIVRSATAVACCNPLPPHLCPQDYLVFGVARNPFSRAVSSWSYTNLRFMKKDSRCIDTFQARMVGKQLAHSPACLGKC